MTGPEECGTLGEWAVPVDNVSCDGERLSLYHEATADAAACNTACVDEDSVAWTWNTTSHECYCKTAPLSPLQYSAGVVSGLACY